MTSPSLAQNISEVAAPNESPSFDFQKNIKFLSFFGIALQICAVLVYATHRINDASPSTLAVTILYGAFNIYIYWEIQRLKNWARRVEIFLNGLLFFPLLFLVRSGIPFTENETLVFFQEVFEALRISFFCIMTAFLFLPTVRVLFTDKSPQLKLRIGFGVGLAFVFFLSYLVFGYISVLSRYVKNEKGQLNLTPSGHRWLDEQFRENRAPAEEFLQTSIPQTFMVEELFSDPKEQGVTLLRLDPLLRIGIWSPLREGVPLLQLNTKSEAGKKMLDFLYNDSPSWSEIEEIHPIENTLVLNHGVFKRREWETEFKGKTYKGLSLSFVKKGRVYHLSAYGSPLQPGTIADLLNWLDVFPYERRK